MDKVHAEKAYDKRRSFNILDEINAEIAIRIRKMHLLNKRMSITKR